MDERYWCVYFAAFPIAWFDSREMVTRAFAGRSRNTGLTVRAVEIWKSQTRRFPHSHRPGCYCCSAIVSGKTETQPGSKCYPCARSNVLPMSQSVQSFPRFAGLTVMCGPVQDKSARKQCPINLTANWVGSNERRSARNTVARRRKPVGKIRRLRQPAKRA